MENTKKHTIGMGMWTQYCVLKFIKEKAPNNIELLKFVNTNRLSMYPPSGSSMNRYLDEILTFGYMDMDGSGNITIAPKGESELQQFNDQSEELASIEKELGIDYSINSM